MANALKHEKEEICAKSDNSNVSGPVVDAAIVNKNPDLNLLIEREIEEIKL